MSPTALVTVGAMLAAFGLGHWVASTAGDAALSREREAAARSQAAQAEHASRRILDAQTRSDQLTTALHVASTHALAVQEQLDAALRRATTGRACLSQPALRLLDGAHNLSVAVPAAGSGADAAHGAVATDTDISLWISRAGQQYDECRRRLDALIDWHTPPEAAQ